MGTLIRQVMPILLTGVLVGCQTEDRASIPAEAFSVRDSAGVLIAENRFPEWTEATAWRVPSDPVLVIGSRDGDSPGTDFGQISDAVRFSDGRIVVADVTTLELRVFDSSGTFLFTMAGSGQGPSEFLTLEKIGIIQGDSVVADDWRQSKHVIFGPDGAVGRVVADPPLVWEGLSGVRVAGWLWDGSYIVSDRPRIQDLPPGTTVVYRQWHHFDPEGNHLREIARLPDSHLGNAGEVINFGPVGVIRTGGAGFWYGFSQGCEFGFYGPNGLTRIFRRECEREPLDSSAKEELRERSLEWVISSLSSSVPPDQRAHMRSRLEADFAEREYADSLRAFASFQVARSGHVWVQEPNTLRDILSPDWVNGSAPPIWTVFSPQGRWLGTVSVPPALQVLEIGEDYLLGIQKDSLDVPYVVVHRIEKP